MITQQEITDFVEQTKEAIGHKNNAPFTVAIQAIRALPRALEIIKEQAARIEELERGKV